ncbi:MAG TPA: enoyl-CoA hydratase/isomerase family protein [Thermoplasmata archaeon]|nr:enoyl-CoA hydratase/isomerase family protein [Thermoplasmata archaeon]
MSAPAFQEIAYEKKEWVATVTINRPHAYNAYTLNTLREMAAAFKDASFDDSVAVIVLTGAGDKAFCTGGDVKEYADVYTQRPRDYWKYMVEFQAAHDMLRNSGKPVIARVNGVCAGGGNEFHIACDLSVAAEHAEFLQVGTRVGSVAAGGATQWLPLLIGDRRAREMLYLCEKVPAAKALEWGLVNWVVPAKELDAKVREVADKLVDKFPECTRYTKAQVNFWKDFAWHMTIPHARDWLSLHFATREPWEGMRAFVEKRPARYRELREEAAKGGATEFLWGAPTRACPSCGAAGLPAGYAFCGRCGHAFG